MGQIDDIIFELQRRVILFKSTTTLPDNTQLGYNGNPNNVVNGATSGQTLIYACPVGTRYQENDGTQWYKKTLPNSWEQFGGSASGHLTGITLTMSGYTVDSISNDSGLTLSSSTSLITEYAVKEYVDSRISSEDFWDRNDTTISPQFSGDDLDMGSGNITGGTFYGDFSEAIKQLGAITKEPTGFENRTSSTISFNNTTREFTITGNTGSFEYYRNGVKVIKTTDTIEIPDVSDGYFVYYNTSDTLVYSTTPWNLLLHVPVAYIIWNTSNDEGILFEGRHGLTMDGATHLELHERVGTYKASGFGISDYTVSGTTDDDNTYSIASGVVADEDIRITTQTLTHDSSSYMVLYRNGANDWTWQTDLDLPFLYGTNVQYNNPQVENFTMTDVPTGKYVNYYVFATTSLNPTYTYPAIPGQAYHDTLTDALAENAANLDLSDIPVQEFAPLYKITWYVDSGYSQSGKTNIVNVSAISDSRVTVEGIAASNTHSNLAGLSSDDHLQYALLGGRSGDTLNIDTINDYLGNGITIEGIKIENTSISNVSNLTVTGDTLLKTLKLNDGVTVSGVSNATGLTENSDSYLPTQKAVKAYVDAQIGAENYWKTGITSNVLTTESGYDSISITSAITSGTLNVSGNITGSTIYGSDLSIVGSTTLNTLQLLSGVTVHNIQNITGSTSLASETLLTEEAIVSYVDSKISEENYWTSTGSVLSPESGYDSIDLSSGNITGSTIYSSGLYNSSLTVNRVVYTTTGGQLITGALQYDGTTLTAGDIVGTSLNLTSGNITGGTVYANIVGTNGNFTNLTGGTIYGAFSTTITNKQVVYSNNGTLTGSVGFEYDSNKLTVQNVDITSNLIVTGTTSLLNTLNVKGATTIDNTLTISGDTKPSITNTFDLGTSSNRWRNIYGANLNIIGDATIIGDLTVSGTTTYLNVQQLNVADNIITVNSGQTGSGVTFVNAGMKVDRGSADPYYFIWNEDTQTFRIGASNTDETQLIEISGDTQAVATRQDEGEIVSQGVAYWNGTERRFDTNSNFKWNSGLFITGVTELNGATSLLSTLSVAGTSTFANTVSITTGGLVVTGNTYLKSVTATQDTLLAIGSDGLIKTAESFIVKISETGVATGTTTTIDTFTQSTSQGVVWDYVITDGTNRRAGTIVATYQGTDETWNESTTIDIGDTSNVDFTVVADGNDVTLNAIIGSGESYDIYVDRKMIG